MHELIGVLSDRKGQFWIAATALFYIVALVPFNLYSVQVAGIALRPAAILPVVCGIFWGPAAAWGLGLGNIAGDLTGSWSPMSIFGLLVNFLMPYLAYLLWHRLMKGREMRLGSYGLASFLAVAFVATLACMFLLAASGTVFFGRPFESKFVSYFGNNIFWALLGGPVLFRLIRGPVMQNDLVYGRAWDQRKQASTGQPE